MLDTEDAARRLLVSAVSDVPPGIDLLGGVRMRQAARRTRTRAVLATTAAAVIAVATTIALTVSQTPSALAAVTAAAARTAAQSYRARVTFSLSEPGFAPSKNTYSGIFNPVLGIGKEIWTNVFNPALPAGQENDETDVYLLIGDYIYTNINPPKSSPLYGKRWEKLPLATLPGRQNGQFGALMPGSPEDQIVSPDDLLAALHSVGQVREIGSASGPGWTGTRYAFTAKLSAITRLRGTVDVDKQGRVRAIEGTMPIMSPPRFGPEKRIGWYTATMTFSDFGVTVSVTAPPAGETYTPPPLPSFNMPASPAPRPSIG